MALAVRFEKEKSLPDIEEGGGGVRVDGAERVVEEVDVGVAVDGPCELDPLLLPAAHVEAPLPDLRQVAVREVLHVLVQRAALEGPLVLRTPHRPPEEDVVAHRAALDPRRLGHIGHRATHGHLNEEDEKLVVSCFCMVKPIDNGISSTLD